MSTRHGTLAATLLLACLIARSQDLPQVKGRIVTADHAPVAGARLSLHETASYAARR